jgi:hypothetical protein
MSLHERLKRPFNPFFSHDEVSGGPSAETNEATVSSLRAELDQAVVDYSAAVMSVITEFYNTHDTYSAELAKLKKLSFDAALAALMQLEAAQHVLWYSTDNTTHAPNQLVHSVQMATKELGHQAKTIHTQLTYTQEVITALEEYISSIKENVKSILNIFRELADFENIAPERQLELFKEVRQMIYSDLPGYISMSITHTDKVLPLQAQNSLPTDTPLPSGAVTKYIEQQLFSTIFKMNRASVESINSKTLAKAVYLKLLQKSGVTLEAVVTTYKRVQQGRTFYAIRVSTDKQTSPPSLNMQAINLITASGILRLETNTLGTMTFEQTDFEMICRLLALTPTNEVA